MTPEALDALVASGASAEMIAAAWKAEMGAPRKRTPGAERTARYRERHKASQSVTVTDETSPPFLDKESVPQTPFKEIKPFPVRETRTRGSHLPDDWRPSTLSHSTVSGGIVGKRGQEWTRRAFETFENHWRAKSGKDGRKSDWQATWANWIIEQDRRDGNGSGGNGNFSGGRKADGFIAALRSVQDREAIDPYAGDGGGMRNASPLGRFDAD